MYGEPEPGMTLVALVKARGNHVEGVPGRNHAVEAIETAAQNLLMLPAISMVPHPVIDAMIDAIMTVEQVLLESDPVLTPSTYSRAPRAALDKQAFGVPPAGTSPFSYTSEFGESEPKLPDRLPIVMGFGIRILTSLILHSASFARRLYDVQEQRLSELAANLLKSYKLLLKREIMGFCAALHTIIQPEERFFAFFEDESDKNLLFYCVRSEAKRAQAMRAQGYLY